MDMALRYASRLRSESIAKPSERTDAGELATRAWRRSSAPD